MRKTAISAVALLACAGISLPAMGAVVLNWDAANNVAVSRQGNDPDLMLSWGSVATNGNLVNYTSGSMSSSVDADYTGQAFGAVSQISSSTGPDNHNDAGEWIESRTTNPSIGSLWLGARSDSADVAVASLVSFGEADWDAAAGASDTISSMSLDYQYAGVNTSMRMAVNSGGTWYISSDNVLATGNNNGTNLTVTASTTWAALSVATAGSVSLMTGDALSYVTTTASLNDLQGVGFFYESSAEGTARARYRATNFVVETIPEPATLGLVGIAGGALLMIRRRLKV